MYAWVADGNSCLRYNGSDFSGGWIQKLKYSGDYCVVILGMFLLWLYLLQAVGSECEKRCGKRVEKDDTKWR